MVNYIALQLYIRLYIVIVVLVSKFTLQNGTCTCPIFLYKCEIRACDVKLTIRELATVRSVLFERQVSMIN